ncbi:hypothetical protein DBV23_10950 [Edwardsiella ictaluri]|nr:hypothetical protein DBV23_10950 [Edwardsiella ictaluri]WJH22092.1 hypothetical protein FGU63_15045 [Edwardsiella ictaluri]
MWELGYYIGVIVVVENNSLASVLAAANANKPGTADKWKEEQQAAIKEACSGNTPMSCQMAVAAIGTVMSGGVLPEAMVISGAISARRRYRGWRAATCRRRWRAARRRILVR